MTAYADDRAVLRSLRSRPGAGLRLRLILGFVGLTAVTGLVTGGTAFLAALVIVATRPRSASRWSDRLLAHAPSLYAWSDRDLLLLLGVAVLALLVVSSLTGWFAATRILRPMRGLGAAAAQVAAGDLTVRLVPSGHDELAELVLTFNAMTESLDGSVGELRRLEAQSRRFVADVSHELRTPLAALTAVTDVLSDDRATMSAPTSEAVRLVVQEIGHLERMVLDLIEMSRFDAGTAALVVDDVDVDAVVRACLARRGWTDAVAVDVASGLRWRLDRRRLDVVLANLVGNAVRYGRPPLQVSARDAEGQLHVQVSDHGHGLTAQELPHIFERFSKGDAARTRSSGSGLGLAIARENVRLHGGAISAANRPTGGAAFTVLLPPQPVQR